MTTSCMRVPEPTDSTWNQASNIHLLRPEVVGMGITYPSRAVGMRTSNLRHLGTGIIYVWNQTQHEFHTYFQSTH